MTCKVPRLTFPTRRGDHTTLASQSSTRRQGNTSTATALILLSFGLLFFFFRKHGPTYIIGLGTVGIGRCLCCAMYDRVARLAGPPPHENDFNLLSVGFGEAQRQILVVLVVGRQQNVLILLWSFSLANIPCPQGTAAIKPGRVLRSVRRPASRPESSTGQRRLKKHSVTLFIPTAAQDYAS